MLRKIYLITAVTAALFISPAMAKHGHGVTDTGMVTATPTLTFTGTRARIGTVVASTGMRPCAVVGGASLYGYGEGGGL